MSQGALCDEQEIGPKDILLRRVPYLDPRYVKDDGTVSSFAFSLRKRNGVKEEGLSVDVEHMSTHARSILRASDFRLYSLVTEDVRGMKLSVCHDPCPKEDPENVAHTLISGTTGKPSDRNDAANTAEDAPGTINERLAKCLARASRRINYPDRQQLPAPLLSLRAMGEFIAQNNTLVALVPSLKDWDLVRTQGWYRIPVRFAPPMVKDGTIRYIAFYFPGVFGAEKQRIQWYSPVTGLVVRKRIELLPDEPHHKHAQWDYYVVGCADLRHLPHIIPSRKPRRLLFIPTTIQKLLTAPEVNYLFNDSPLEDMLWLELLEAGIPSERQHQVTVGQGRYKLDFAVFCKDRNLAIECDGDAHHMRRSAVEKDKKRSNALGSRGWTVLQFTTKELTTNMPGTMQVIRDAIAHYGGIWHSGDAA